MAQHELLVKLGLQSDSFTRNIKNVNNQLKLTDAEFKKLQSSTDNFGKSQKDLASKLNTLNSTKEKLTAKTILYSNKIKELNNNIADETKKHEDLALKLEKEKNKLAELEATHKKSSKAYKDQAKIVKSTQEEYDKSQKKIENYNLSLQKHQIELTKTETEINKLNKSISDTRFDKMMLPLTNVNDKLASLSSNFDKISQKMGAVGSGLTATVTTPIMGAGTAIVKFGADFDYSMSKVAALSGTTGNELKTLENKAREMGKATSFTAKEAADGLNYMALAGWSTREMLEGIEPVLRLAEAGGEDLATTSDLVTDSMSSLGLTTKDLSEYLDKVAKAAVITNADVGQLLRSYNQVGGTFQRLNVPLDESAALLGVLANRGLKAEQAGRSMSSILINLTSGAGQAGVAMKKLGVSAYDSKGKFKGVEQVLLELHKELNKTENGTKKYTDAQKDMYLSMIGGKTQIRTLDALLNGVAKTTANGKTEFQNLKEEITNSEGALMEMATKMKDNVQGDWEKFTSSVSELGLVIYDTLEPSIRQILQSLTRFVEKLTELDEGTLKFVVKAALMAASIGPLLLAFSGLFKVLSIITGTISTVGTGFVKFAKIAKEVFTKVKGGAGIFAALNGAIAGLPALIFLVVAAFTAMATAVGESESILATLQEKLGGFGTFLSGLSEMIAGFVQLTIGNLIIGFGTVGKVLVKLFTGQWNEIGDVIKEGGSKIAQNSTKAYNNIGMSSTLAIKKIRSMTSEELNGLTTDMQLILEKLPTVTYDSAEKLARQFTNGLKHLDNDAIEILSSTSENMNMLFRGIREGMSNDEAVAQYTKNLQSLAITGGVEVGNLEKEISDTLRLINNNMADSGDRFAREAEVTMEKFGLVASQGINAAAGDIASHISKLNVNTISQLKGMGNSWSLVFKDIKTDGSMTTAQMAKIVEGNIKIMAENNPKFVEQLREEMKMYFDKLPEDADENMLKLKESVENGTNSAVSASEGKGKLIEENLEFDATTPTEQELQNMNTAITNSGAPTYAAASGVGQQATDGYKQSLEGLDQATIDKMMDQANNIKSTGEQSKSAMSENATGSIDQFIATWDANSGRINESVNSTFDNINRLTLLKWGNTTKGLSEVDRWLSVVSGKSSSTYTALSRLTSLRWGNTTKGLSEVNRWLGTVSAKANSTKSAMTPLTSLRWGNTTKGLSEVNRWLGTVATSSGKTKTALQGIVKVTYGSVTKGLSEINRWLGTVKTSASSAKSYLQNIANVRFGSVTKGLSEVNRWLGIVASKANTARYAVASVSTVRPRSLVVEPNKKTVEFANKMDILSRENIDFSPYNLRNTYLNRNNAIEKGIASVYAGAKNTIQETQSSTLISMLVKQNQLLMELISSDRDIILYNNLEVDGKSIAKSSAVHTMNVIENKRKRENRLAGLL